MKTVTNKQINKRSLVSAGMFFSFLFLPYSGIMNHNLQNTPFNMERHFWMSVHNISAIIFVVFLIFHIYYNKTSLANHLKKIRITKEAVLAFSIVITIITLFSLHSLHVR